MTPLSPRSLIAAIAITAVALAATTTGHAGGASPLPGPGEGRPGADVSKIWMTEADLEAALAGKAVAGEYPNGRPFKETYEAGGRVSYADDLHASGGRWSIEAGTFCTIYDDDPMGGCFRVHKVGSNCYEFYFVARTEEQARKDPKEPDWTARAWLEDEPSTCKERISAC
jgi:hypothetical protein